MTEQERRSDKNTGDTSESPEQPSEVTSASKPGVLDKIIHRFNQTLYSGEYNRDGLQKALLNAQTISFRSGDMPPATIFDRLSTMATEALLTAQDKQDEEGVKVFTELQEGYQSALRMLGGYDATRTVVSAPIRPMTSPKA